MSKKKLVLPALVGKLGDWTYYSCLMQISDLANRVKYGHEVHERNEVLSDFIQRELDDGKRAKDIANYLKQKQEHFFSSLVIAVYGGKPNWLDITLKGNLRTDRGADIAVDSDVIDQIGFLELSGNEKLYALDGQHRLAGMRKVVEEGNDTIAEEYVSVIFVSHNNTTAGVQRTRRLFTTLNQTAVKIKKSEIITLSEDDAVAITVRRLIESSPDFQVPRVSIDKSTNIPNSDKSAFTSMNNLYDVLMLLIRSATGLKTDRLKFNRPSDDTLNAYYDFAQKYFSCLKASYPEFENYFATNKDNLPRLSLRSVAGGSILFRPIGQSLIAEVTSELIKKQREDGKTINSIEFSEIKRVIENLPVKLDDFPYLGLIWNSSTGNIRSANKTLARRILGYLSHINNEDPDSLLVEYRNNAVGISSTHSLAFPPRG